MLYGSLELSKELSNRDKLAILRTLWETGSAPESID